MRLPLMTSTSSSVSLPHCDLTLPLNCFQFPSISSQFMIHSCFLVSDNLTRAERTGSAPPLTLDAAAWRRGRELTLLQAAAFDIHRSDQSRPVRSSTTRMIRMTPMTPMPP